MAEAQMTLLNREEFNQLARNLGKSTNHRKQIERKIITLVREGDFALEEVRTEYLLALEQEELAETKWKEYEKRILV
jgi:hypothetical protein